MVRSVSVYYSGGVAGKKKYRKIYKDSCYKIAMQGGVRVKNMFGYQSIIVPSLGLCHITN